MISNNELVDLLDDFYCSNCNIRTKQDHCIKECYNRSNCLESIKQLYKESKKIYDGGKEYEC